MTAPDGNSPYRLPSDEISVLNLFRPLWDSKLLIVGVTSVAALVSIIVALLLPSTYRAEALLAPNAQENVGGISTLATEYGGLADLAGISMPAGSASNKTDFGIEVLRSRKFIAEFIERHGILVPLMAATGWIANTGELVINSELYDATESRWVRDVEPPQTAKPSMQEAVRRFRETLSISKDPDTGFVTISIEHVSPELARQWVDWLIDDLNATIRERDISEAEQAIEYLNGQIAATSLTELQKVFFGLIEEHTKTAMLANVTPEYVFRIIDPAVAPEERFKPRRTLIVVLSTFLGFTGSVILVMVSGSMASQLIDSRA